MLVLSVAGVRSSVLQLRLIALAPVCRQRMRQKLQIKPKTTNKTKKKKKSLFFFFLLETGIK
jgi:hypothetical protein